MAREATYADRERRKAASESLVDGGERAKGRLDPLELLTLPRSVLLGW